MRISPILFSSMLPAQLLMRPNSVGFGIQTFREDKERQANHNRLVVDAGNFIYLLLGYINIRPDSAFREDILKRLSDNPKEPIYVEKLSKGLKFIDGQGWLHWFKFGKRLLEGTLTCKVKSADKKQIHTGKDFFRHHDVYIIVNRKTNNNDPNSKKRDGVKAFHIPDPFLREWPTKLQKQDIEEIDYAAVKSFANAGKIALKEPNDPSSGKSNFVYAIVAIKRDSPHPNYIWERKIMHG